MCSRGSFLFFARRESPYLRWLTIVAKPPDSALDLPLKILIAEISDGSTRISYNSPAFLQSRYGLEPDLMKPFAAVEQIATAIAH
jgi:uncharacterized protein (DUF302 family)